MRRHPFLRSLAFAVFAAGALLVLAPPLTGVAGARGALRALLLAGVAAYVAWVAPSRGRGLAAAGLAATLGLVLLALPQGLFATALCAAALLGVCRSGVLYRSRPARALLFELTVNGCALLLARFLAGPGLASLAFAAWGFWLCQSGFFLVGGLEARPDDPPHGDPFEHARGRILALLE